MTIRSPNVLPGEFANDDAKDFCKQYQGLKQDIAVASIEI